MKDTIHTTTQRRTKIYPVLTTPMKQSKVTTTVRLDTELKRRVDECARANHMDFTTFLSFSLQNTLQNGATLEPYYEVSEEYAKKLDDMVRKIDSGEEKTYGPFEGEAAIDFLKTLY